MKESILEEKSRKFAVRIVKLAEYLVENKDVVIANQLLRSGTSVGANIYESTFAASKMDFVNKLKIAQKEANETKYWLYLLKDTGKLDLKLYNSLNDDLIEIIKIVSSSVLTTKNNL